MPSESASVIRMTLKGWVGVRRTWTFIAADVRVTHPDLQPLLTRVDALAVSRQYGQS